MMRALVLRPEPGNARTCAALAAAGIAPVALPLFAAVPLAWSPPDPEAYDALLLTSAQAVRLAGVGLARVAGLPVVAVGAATAAAARAAGLEVAVVGDGDAAAAVARAGAFPRLLHLAGRDHVAQPGADILTVYASEPLPVATDVLAAAIDGVALLHSARAAARFALIADDLPRGRVRIAALSPAIAASAGGGWARVIVAGQPNDRALIEALVAPD
ncbi:uroporphyrinogen-III synthase [Sphingomonas phyllosphaerae]|uniref:uroporphyrinogen-III synthase n=1 Tax=Sphingomonas phyllosphaerae TaxID=257003 RepID=UPI0003FC0E56|nr:uroporphyrinogen-III synthase [Sphingomonas phyllosphaerae]